ncbi:MAG: hypothetical protein GX050_00620 [Firmicutes bacterium]|nr:hypothetical protein [Bacillota bacterium]
MTEKRRLRVPPAVFTNFIYLNLLIILSLLFSSLGLHFFLRPKSQPVTYGPKERPKDPGIMAWWEMDLDLAHRLLNEGIPFLKRRNNP